MKKILSLLLTILVLFIPIGVWAQEEDIPSPTQNFYVNDFANVLDSQTEQYIMQHSIRLDELTGAQVVVVTLATIGDIPLEEYSLNILRGWGIGSAEKNNGVLILVAVDDRKSRIEVGYGLEGALPDSKTGWIQDDYMIPYFSVGDFSTGILEGYKAILMEIYNEYNIETDSLEELSPLPSYEHDEESQERDNGSFFIIFLIVFLLLDRFFLGGRILRFLLFMLFTGRRGGPRGGNWGGGSWGGGGWSGGGGFKGGGGSGGGGGSSRSW